MSKTLTARGGGSGRLLTRAEAARIAAGLSAAQLAKRARITVAYLRRIERHGCAPFRLAQRLAFILRESGVKADEMDYLFTSYVPGTSEVNATTERGGEAPAAEKKRDK